MARHRAALADALRDGPAARVADARDRQWDILRDAGGRPCRLVPSDLPPWGTIYRWFAAWRDDGRFERINHALVMADRERAGRDASPSAAIIDGKQATAIRAKGNKGRR